MRRARVVALQRTDTERAEAVERKVVRDPRSQFVALIRVQVTDRIVLRESLELRILLRAAGGNRSGVRRFTDDVAAQLRVGVIPADVQPTECSVSALQDDSLIGAPQIVAVDQEAQVDVLSDEWIKDVTGAAVGDARVEVAELPVLIVGAQERVRVDTSANAEGVFVYSRGAKPIRNLCGDARRAAAREERSVVLASNALEPVEDLSQRFGAVHALNRGPGVDPVENRWRTGRRSGIADVAVGDLRGIDAVAGVESQPPVAERVVDHAESRADERVIGHFGAGLVDAAVVIVTPADV